MKRLFHLYWILLCATQRSRMQHRMNYIIWLVTLCLSYWTILTNIWLMTNRFGNIAGWNFAEIGLLFSLLLMSYGIGGFLFWQQVTIQDDLRSGNFDRYLVRPLRPFFFFVSERCEPTDFAHFFAGTTGLILSGLLLDIHWTADKVLFLIPAVLGGALIQGAIMLFCGVIGFWTLDSSSLYGYAYVPARNFAFYPLSAFDKPIKIILVTILPMAFVNFFPAQYILGKQDFAGFPAFFQYLGVPVGVAVMALIVFFWHRGLRRYESTGS